MDKGGIVFNVKIADVPIEIRCRHNETREFFSDYITNETEKFRAEALEEDVAFAEAHLIKQYGEPLICSEADLENTALQHVISKKLLDYGTLFIHGSALCMDGEAYIFVAPSGTGKSTHARLWRETFGERVWMINDDKPMVRIENGSAVVYGTPWDGKHHLSTNASAPLKAIVSLNRDAANHIEPLEKADAFPVMLRQTAWARTGSLKLQVMQLESALLDTVAFYRLGCNLDPDAALVAWKGVQNG